MLWDNISTVGSQIVYQCNSGYHNAGEGNMSVCNASGEWDGASPLCQGDDDISVHTIELPASIVMMQSSQMLTTHDNLYAVVEQYECYWHQLSFKPLFQKSHFNI